MSRTASQRITVYVSSEPRRFFLGLRVRHAVGHETAWRVERGEAIVEDGDGNQLDLDGALHDGQRLTIRTVPGK
jgi:hypothetical protein